MGKKNKHANVNVAYMGFDVLYGLLAFVITILIVGRGTSLDSLRCIGICFCSVLLVIFFNINKKVYNTTLFFYADRIFAYITRSCIFANVIVGILSYLVGQSIVPIKFFLVFCGLEYVLMLISAYLTRKILRKYSFHAPRTLFVGEVESYKKAIHFLDRNNMGVDIVGYISETPLEEREDADKYLDVLSNLENVIHENSIDQVFFRNEPGRSKNYLSYYELCMELGVTVRELEVPYKLGQAQNYVCSVGTYPMITYHNVVMNVYAKTIKRIFDIVFSILGIILSSPFMLITAIAVKVDSKGPIIFAQERVGLNGRHFKMYKFRSMCADAEALKKKLEAQNKMSNNLMFKIDDDPRITRVGKFIRKTSLDELPQFFNVLFGTMSLVGTRPPTVDEVAAYDTRHWRRLSIKPGITGMWQTSGRSQITDFDEVVSLDKQYIDNWSIGLDIKILFKTVFQVFIKKEKDAF